MKKSRFEFLLLLPVILMSFICSCKDEVVTNYVLPSDGTEIPTNLDSTSLKIESFFEVQYGLDYPFLKVKNDFFFFETYYLKLFKYRLNEKTWHSNFIYTTEEYKSQSKYFFTEGDSVVMVSYKVDTNNHSLDVYSVNKENLSLTALRKGININLALSNEMHSFLLMDSNRIIIVVTRAQTVIVLNLKTFSVQYLSAFPQLPIYGSSVSNAVVNGKIGRDVYLYYYAFKKMFKLNLDSFSFSEIPIPKYVSHRMNPTWDRAALVGNLFCFWPAAFYYTFYYDINNNKWLIENRNPFYQRMFAPLYHTHEDGYLYYKNGRNIDRMSSK